MINHNIQPLTSSTIKVCIHSLIGIKYFYKKKRKKTQNLRYVRQYHYSQPRSRLIHTVSHTPLKKITLSSLPYTTPPTKETHLITKHKELSRHKRRTYSLSAPFSDHRVLSPQRKLTPRYKNKEYLIERAQRKRGRN